MKYKSTRDGNKEYTFEEAIFSGYAPDGGLFVPSSLPFIAVQDLMRWSPLSFPELAYHVIVSEYYVYILHTKMLIYHSQQLIIY